MFIETEQDQNDARMLFVCRSCQQGRMEATLEVNELEGTDTYICDHCGDSAVIPSPLIIFSQIFCGITGGLVAGYLCFIQTLTLIVTLQGTHDASPTEVGALLLIALLFLAGFGYTLYQGCRGLRIRRLYVSALAQARLQHTAAS